MQLAIGDLARHAAKTINKCRPAGFWAAHTKLREDEIAYAQTVQAVQARLLTISKAEIRRINAITGRSKQHQPLNAKARLAAQLQPLNATEQFFRSDWAPRIPSIFGAELRAAVVKWLTALRLPRCHEPSDQPEHQTSALDLLVDFVMFSQCDMPEQVTTASGQEWRQPQQDLLFVPTTVGQKVQRFEAILAEIAADRECSALAFGAAVGVLQSAPIEGVSS